MCRKYHVKGEDLTLQQVLDRLSSKKPVVNITSKVVYSKQEIVSASKVLERLATKINSRATANSIKNRLRR